MAIEVAGLMVGLARVPTISTELRDRSTFLVDAVEIGMTDIGIGDHQHRLGSGSLRRGFDLLGGCRGQRPGPLEVDLRLRQRAQGAVGQGEDDAAALDLERPVDLEGGAIRENEVLGAGNGGE